MPDFIKIHPNDNVAVALRPIPKGTEFAGITANMALLGVQQGENVIKYGFPIGHATAAITPGDWVHTHNMATNLSGEMEYAYHPKAVPVKSVPAGTFQGYRRKDGRVT